MNIKRKNIFIDGPVSPVRIAEMIQQHQSKTNIGAHWLFLGQVRADKKGDEVVHCIEYSAYEEMALDKMHEIREEIFAKHPISCMHVLHSLGKVHAGEICFFIFVSSPHRQASREACEEIVERIKKDLPIWGKEITNGAISWKENI